MYPTSTRYPAAADSMRMEDIRRREQELDQRERELAQRADHMRRFGRNNWPPFYPIVYHDIDAEIPPDSQPIMRNVYRLWLTLVGTLILNVVACVFVSLSDLISSLVYLVVITAGSFLGVSSR